MQHALLAQRRSPFLAPPDLLIGGGFLFPNEGNFRAVNFTARKAGPPGRPKTEHCDRPVKSPLHDRRVHAGLNGLGQALVP